MRFLVYLIIAHFLKVFLAPFLGTFFAHVLRDRFWCLFDVSPQRHARGDLLCMLLRRAVLHTLFGAFFRLVGRVLFHRRLDDFWSCCRTVSGRRLLFESDRKMKLKTALGVCVVFADD